MTDITQILSQIEQGDPSASDQLLPLVYEELRKLAAARLAHEKPGQTLQATALVHDAYIRLVDVEKAQHWNSRGHFFGAAAEAMRRILVEPARREQKTPQKRGGDLQRESISIRIDFAKWKRPSERTLLAVDEALQRVGATKNAACYGVGQTAVFCRTGCRSERPPTALGISTSSTADRHTGRMRGRGFSRRFVEREDERIARVPVKTFTIF